MSASKNREEILTELAQKAIEVQKLIGSILSFEVKNPESERNGHSAAEVSRYLSNKTSEILRSSSHSIIDKIHLGECRGIHEVLYCFPSGTTDERRMSLKKEYEAPKMGYKIQEVNVCTCFQVINPSETKDGKPCSRCKGKGLRVSW